MAQSKSDQKCQTITVVEVVKPECRHLIWCFPAACVVRIDEESPLALRKACDQGKVNSSHNEKNSPLPLSPICSSSKLVVMGW